MLKPDQISLRRLSNFIDIVYALIFFHLIVTYLPKIENMAWADKPYGLLSLLIENNSEILRIIIGAGLALMYWNQNNSFFKHLNKTNGPHMALSLIQVFLVCLFVYFAIADPGLVTKSSPAMQAGCLAIAGFMGIYNWRYAFKKGLTRDDLTKEEAADITKSNLMEPLTAVVNTGLAFVSPLVWTLAWFLLPVLFSWILKKRKA